MNKPPTDRPVAVLAADDGKTYHVWLDDDKVEVLVGCHRATLTPDEAWTLGIILKRYGERLGA